jgi:hypothetical protein
VITFFGESMIMKIEQMWSALVNIAKPLGYVVVVFAAMQSSLVLAQSGAGVNVAGGTRTACAVAASNTGGVSTGDIGGTMRHLAAMQVPSDLPQAPLVKALRDPFPLQDLYSRLIPVINNKFVIQKNEKLLKQIAERYIKVQQQNEFSYLIVDILTIPAVGKEGAARSQAFAKFIATSLAKFGVKNVKLDNQFLDGQAPSPDAPVKKS